MNELINQRKEYVKELMKFYNNSKEYFITQVREVLSCEQYFVDCMNEMISPLSYQKALNNFIEQSNNISKGVVEHNLKFNELLNDFMKKDNEFSIKLLTNVKNNTFSRKDDKENIKQLEEEYDNDYKKIINEYSSTLDELFSRIDKGVKINRKFVIEYGSFKLTNEPVINEYKPIYDKHDDIYNKFIYELSSEAYRLNFLPQEIKSTYSRVVNLLDENYDIFADLLKDLQN